MKKILLIVFLIPVMLHAQNFEVQNPFGVDCIMHEIKAGETLYSIAKLYYIRPSALVVCNGIENNSRLKVGSNIYIPLTETNFYKTANGDYSEAQFYNVLYTVKNQDSKSNIYKEYGLNDYLFQKLNPNKTEILTNDKICIGLVKVNTGKTQMQEPAFIKAEKYEYGNELEKAEARYESIKVQEKEKPNTFYVSKIEQFSAKDILDKDRTKDVRLNKGDATEPSTNVASVEKPKVEKKKEIAENTTNNKIENKEISKAEKKDVVKITKQEEKFLEQSKTAKPVASVKTKRKSAYEKEKERREQLIKERLANAQKTNNVAVPVQPAKEIVKVEKKETIPEKPKVALPKKEVIKPEQKKVQENKIEEKVVALPAKEKVPEKEVVFEEEKEVKPKVVQPKNEKKKVEVKKKMEEKIVESNKKEIIEPTKNAAEHIVKVNPPIVETKSDIEPEGESPFIENQLQRLSLLKNTKGKVSFFYSGNAGAKFYVFTNLAGKGGIVKITNPENGKFILAEVIDYLPDDDFSKGYIAKLSENAQMILGVSKKYFTATVYY